MLKPKRVIMGNPLPINGFHIVEVFVNPSVWDYIESLPYVMTTTRLNGNLIHVWIDGLYDIEDAWLDLYEQLTNETQKVQLNPIWGLDDEEQS